MGDGQLDRVPDRAEPERLEDRLDRVYRLALRITGVEDDAAEAVEDALRTAAVLTGQPPSGAVLYRAVARAAYRRRCARRPPGPAVALDDLLPPLGSGGRHFDSVDDWSNRIEEPALHGALHGIVTDAIDALPADARAALVLHDVEGASPSDIAEVLGVDVTGVRLRVHRARLFVRKRLSEYFESVRVA